MTGHLSSAIHNPKYFRALFCIHSKVKLRYGKSEKPGSHRVRLTGCKVLRTEPVLQVVLWHALVALKNTRFFFISVT